MIYLSMRSKKNIMEKSTIARRPQHNNVSSKNSFPTLKFLKKRKIKKRMGKQRVTNLTKLTN